MRRHDRFAVVVDTANPYSWTVRDTKPGVDDRFCGRFTNEKQARYVASLLSAGEEYRDDYFAKCVEVEELQRGGFPINKDYEVLERCHARQVETISEKSNQIEGLCNQIKEQWNEINQKDARIEDLVNQVNDRDDTIDVKNKYIRELHDEVNYYKSIKVMQLDKIKSIKADMKSKLDAKDRLIKSMQDDLGALRLNHKNSNVKFEAICKLADTLEEEADDLRDRINESISILRSDEEG